MRICMLGYTFYEIDQRVRRYAEALVDRGDQVEFIGLGKEGQPKEGFFNGVRVFRIQTRDYNEKGKLSYLFRLLRFLMKSMFAVTKNHLRNPYDLIHVHSVPDFEVFAAWIPRLTGAKIILDIHDLVPEFYATKFHSPVGSLTYRFLLIAEKISTAFANHVIIANDVWRGRLISRAVKASDCTTILNYPDRIVPRGLSSNGKDQKFIVLYPGTLNHHQGVDIAIEAFALIKDKIPQVELHIYGQGAEFGALSKMISSLGLGERVCLRPFVSREEIVRIMEESSLGIDPKRKGGFADEAFGVKIFEFMSLGVPVVVSDTTANRYYFSDSVVRFCRGGDARDLAGAILELYQDTEARRRLVQNGREFIRAYQWNVKKSDYLKLVDSLVGSSKRIQTQL